MAKTDSFFIRGTVDTIAATGFSQATVDIGAFVDPLQKAIMKIHNVEWKVDDESGGPASNLTLLANNDARICYQLTTQSQTAMVDLADKAVIASGVLFITNNSGTDSQVTFMSNVEDVGPQSWTNGYLVGVDDLYLGVDSSRNISSGNLTISFVAECTMETLTKEAAISLALSQQ
jgi:hypothetical protein